MTTLPQQDTIIQYLADGAEDEYIATFYVPESSDIAVYVTLSGNTAIPEDDIKTLNVDYTFSSYEDPYDGGTVTFLEGKIPPNNAVVTLSRDVQASLDVEFADAKNFSGANLDDVLIRLLLITQQNKTYALFRNLSYRVNSFNPNVNIEANTQIPILEEGQIWVGSGDGVTAVTLEENPDVSILRSQLENDQPGTDGGKRVGYYDVNALEQSTVSQYLNYSKIFGTAGGTANALTLTIPNSEIVYRAGMEVDVLITTTNTNFATLNINGLGDKGIYRDNVVPSQPEDLIINQHARLTYDGTKFVHTNGAFLSTPSGVSVPFNGTNLKPGYLLEDGLAISRTIYNALYSNIGTTWGIGDGSTTFNKPNSQRRTIVGSGGAGSVALPNTTGSTGGAETDNTLIAHGHGVIDPGHSHSISPLSPAGGSAGSGVEAFHTSGNINTNGSSTGITITSSGSGSSFNILQPSRVATMMIKI